METRGLRYLFLAFAVCLMAACSPRSYILSPVKVKTPVEIAVVEPPKKAEPSHDTLPEELMVDPDNDHDSSVPISYEFSGNETEHIKFARYDPFGAGGVFEVDMDNVEYCYPIEGKFSSGYGARGRGMHSGVDIVAPAGTPIYAMFDGTVRLAKPYSGYGNVIVLRHDSGLETVYAHNQRNLVNVGQKVKCGDQIALCGRTGTATTNHLHFEVRVIGATINPALLLNVEDKSIRGGVLKVVRMPNGSIKATHYDPQSEIIIPTEKPKANESRGMKVDGRTYDAPKDENRSTGNNSKDSTAAKYHTIKGGETMSGIAQKYKTTISAICKLNNMSTAQADKIRAGQKLRVK